MNSVTGFRFSVLRSSRMNAGMKKAKLQTRRTSSEGPALARTVQRKPLDLGEIRWQIEEIVGNGAVSMVEDTIESVGKGHFLGMKYLFAMIRLFAAASTENRAEPDSLAASRWRRLALPEASVAEAGG